MLPGQWSPQLHIHTFALNLQRVITVACLLVATVTLSRSGWHTYPACVVSIAVGSSNRLLAGADYLRSSVLASGYTGA